MIAGSNAVTKAKDAGKPVMWAGCGFSSVGRPADSPQYTLVAEAAYVTINAVKDKRKVVRHHFCRQRLARSRDLTRYIRMLVFNCEHFV
jgi:hypothetical protein